MGLISGGGADADGEACLRNNNLEWTIRNDVEARKILSRCYATTKQLEKSRNVITHEPTPTIENKTSENFIVW